MSVAHVVEVGVQRHHPHDKRRGLPARVVAVLRDVATRHGVGVTDILSPAKERSIAYARQAVCAELRDMQWGGARPSFAQIGAWLGRDYSTVIFAVNAHRTRMREPYREAVSIYLTGRP